MRNLTKTLVAVSLMSSASAYALGISDIKLRSALNENLNAEIALFAAEGDSISNIQVKLAPPGKFDQAGVPWSYFLSKIHFTPVTKPDGSVVIEITSTEALKEPFLNFLLEVTWPKGVQYREFTVLVDPPSTYKNAVVPVITRPAAEQPVFVSPQTYNTPTQSPESAPYQPNNVVESDAIPDEYGPVRKRDTLWKIANRFRPSGVSTAQMAMAIYDKNPEAFSRPNVNNLITGKILDLPKKEDALEMSPRKALHEFKEQRRVFWQEIREEREAEAARRAALKAAEEPKGVSATPPDNALLKAPPVDVPPKEAPAELKAETKPTETVAKPAEPVKQLKLEPPIESTLGDKFAVAAGESSAAEMQEAHRSVAAVTSAKKQELALEAQNIEKRFQQIELQLASMQKLLEVSNEKLGVTQKNDTAPLKISEDQLKSLVPEAPVSPSMNAPLAQPGDAQLPPAAEAVNPSIPSVKPETLPVKPAPISPVNSTESFPNYYIKVGGLGTLVLGALGWLWWRKRKESYTEDFNDLFTVPDQANVTVSHTDGAFKSAKPDHSAPYDMGMVSESAFLSEFTPSEFDAFEVGHAEIDPIAEADVYLAYGRYQQAEELIRQAIVEQPERNECKLKLLEIFQANENKVAFDAYVQELQQQGKRNDFVFWSKVVDMAGAPVSDTENVLNSHDVAETKPAEQDISSFSIDEVGVEGVNAAIDNSVPVNQSLKSGDLEREGIINLTLSAGTEDVDSAINVADLNTNNDAINKRLSTFDASETNLLDFDLSQFRTTTELPEEAHIPKQLDPNVLEFKVSSSKPTSVPDADDDFLLPIPSVKETIPADSFFQGEDSVVKADKTSQSSTAPAMDFDLNAFEEFALPQEGDDLTLGQSEDYNFDFTLPDETEQIQSDSVNTLENDIAEFDFDIDAFGKTSQTSVAKNTLDVDIDSLSEDSKTDDDEGFNFDFSLDDTVADLGASEVVVSQELTLDDFDFSLDDLKSVKDIGPQAQENSQFAEFDFETPDSESVLGFDDAVGQFRVDDLTDGNGSLETKINLANAYIDMGDIDAAKSILDMLMQGPKNHQQAAQTILEKIS